MNFAEVVAEVIRMTERPDKIIDIKRNVNAAINFCVTEGNFSRDLEEDEYDLVPTSYTQSIDVADLTRFRKVQYIRPSTHTKYLTHLTADKVFSPSGKEACNVFYQSGDSIKMKLNKLSPTALIGHFRYAPTLVNDDDEFWLLELSPYMIIDKAAAITYAQVGNKAESDKHEGQFSISFVSAVRDYKYGANYG